MVLLGELLLSIFSRRFRQFVPPAHRRSSILLPLVPRDAPDVAEVSQVLHGVVLLQVGGDGLQADDGQGVGAGSLPLLLAVSLQQIHGCVQPVLPRRAAAGPAFLLDRGVGLGADRWAPPTVDDGEPSLCRVPPPLSVDLLADLLQVPQSDGVAGFDFGDVLLQLQNFGFVVLESQSPQNHRFVQTDKSATKNTNSSSLKGLDRLCVCFTSRMLFNWAFSSK